MVGDGIIEEKESLASGQVQGVVVALRSFARSAHITTVLHSY